MYFNVYVEICLFRLFHLNYERGSYLKKKIIVITKSMYSGGAERVIAQLLNYFVQKDVDCCIITTDNERIGYSLNESIRVISIGKKSNNKLIDRIKRYTIIRRIVKNEKPNLVLSMPEDTGVYVLLGLLGTRIPVYISERNNPWVMPDVKITRILRKLMYPFATGIIFQTQVAQSFFSRGIRKKSIILPNPVDGCRIPQPFYGIREKIIVGAGRLSKQKNFELLIRSFSRFVVAFPEYQLVIYGEGEERSKLENLIETLRIKDKVSLPGRKDNLLDLMNSKAVFVLSSDYEGMPNVLIEAMCMGMPVISTDCPSGGPKELIINKENGLLIKTNSEEELYKAMCHMVTGNNASKMGKAAYKLRDSLTSNKIFEDWYNYFFDLSFGDEN